jgi:prepilin-type N-terminal cleavage/methylation domain-containing protein
MSFTTSLGRNLSTRCPNITSGKTGFTLIELLIVITIIAVLIGIAFPAYQGIQDRARKVQAKNDLTQIAMSITAFQTDYGVYPSTYQPEMTYDSLNSNTNDKLFDALRGQDTTINPRNVVYISPPVAKNGKGGLSDIAPRQFFDPWGKPYIIRIDTNFDNQVTNPYAKNAGPTMLDAGVIAWSFGKDAKSDTVPGPAPDKNTGINSDDVISWQ